MTETDDENELDLTDIDPTLESLVRMANQGIGMTVTLSVGGIIVTGTTMPFNEYYQSLADEVEQIGQGDFAKVFAQVYREEGEKIKQEEEKDSEEAQPTPLHIHLRDARYVLSSGDLIPTRGTIWRGKLKAVDGYSLGILGRG